MWRSALFFVLLTLFATSLSEPDIERSLAKFRKALGTKLLAVDAVPAPKPPVVLISKPAQPVHTSLGIIQTYLGTETNNETAEAIQGAQNLVSSGILSPLSESNPNYSGEKKPCHHKEDVNSNKDTVLSQFSNSNNNNTPIPQTATPCRHKETSTQKPLSQSETLLQPNKDSNSDTTPVTKKPCHHSSIQTITSTVALNSNSDKVDVVEQRPVIGPKPEAPQVQPWHGPVSGQVIVGETAYIPDNKITFVQTVPSYISSLDCNRDKVEVVHRPVLSPVPVAPQLPPWQFSTNGQVVVEETNYIPNNPVTFVKPGLNISSSSSFSLGSNNDKIEIFNRPVLSPVPPVSPLPPWHLSANGQVVVEETGYIPDNQVMLVQPGLNISSSSSSSLGSNNDKIEIFDRPVLSPIPAAPQLPPWHLSANGQVVVEEATHFPHNQVNYVKPGVSISSYSSSLDCNNNKIEIVDRPVLSAIPAAPQLPSWQVPFAGQVLVGESEYIPDIHIAIDQHFPSAIPEAPHLPPVWQAPASAIVQVEENAYVSNNQEQSPCPYKTYVNNKPYLSKFMFPNTVDLDRTKNIIYNQGLFNFPPVISESSFGPPVPINVVSLPVSEVKVPANPLPVITTIAEAVPVPLDPLPVPIPVVDVPSSYTYQQVKSDGSVETTYALQDGVHTRHVSNPYNAINSFREYSQRPVNNLLSTNIKSYLNSIYPTLQSQNNRYPHIETGFNKYNVHNNPYDYNAYPGQYPQRPYNPYPSGYNSVPRPQGNHYQPGHHVHPQSFNHLQQQHSNNFVQPSYGGYSYKQIHGDGSITSYQGSDDNVKTRKSGSPHLSASKEVVKKSAPQMIGESTSANIPIMIAQEGVNPLYFSYMFKQLGFNGASIDSRPNHKVMPSPAKLPVVNTNFSKPKSSLPAPGNSVSNVHLTSAFTNSNDISPESSSGSEVSATIDPKIKAVEGTSDLTQSNPGFKVSYGIGEKTDSRKHSIEYNPIIVLDTTTGRSNYYYGQTNSDGLKTEYIGDKEKVVIQNVDDSPKTNVRRKYRGDIPE